MIAVLQSPNVNPYQIPLALIRFTCTRLFDPAAWPICNAVAIDNATGNVEVSSLFSTR